MPTYVRDSGVWKEVSGSSFIGNIDTTDQVSTGTTTGIGTYYPTFVSSNNSTRQNEFLYTDAGINYNPSTNSLGIGKINPSSALDVNGTITASNIPFFRTGPIISANYTITPSYNEMSVGPITINSGVTVTVSSGGNWIII